ncbi:hypothetical protein FGO68_gene11791 [Halteria grandinella]|uniref:TLDc domain-containing protein n=1 Tax=Halteria grandinella TaxID=5974 RepID=A0A8J8NKG0_HALGN|nr:hypothetical protein FGO68_gene11791 [Halteria grandinella]
MNITEDEGSWLLEQVKVPNLSLKPVLLYQATRDGWLTADFHRKVDGLNNTYAFFKYKETQRRAAGFTSLAYTSSYKTEKDNFSFVLSIDKRIVAKAAAYDNYVDFYELLGPYFHDQDTNTILCALWDPLYERGTAYCGFPKYYMPFEDNEKCSLSGLQNGSHELDELEVWQIL